METGKILVLLALGFACISVAAGHADRDDGGESAAPAPEAPPDGCSSEAAGRCCNGFEWRILTDPSGLESETGCKVECCEKKARALAKRLKTDVSQLRRGVQRGTVQDLGSCIARIIENLSRLEFELPAICCKVPIVRLFPFCA